MTTQDPVIKVESLCKSFGSKEVLRNVNFEACEKDALVILGQSGTGKSVLFKTILGLLDANSGNIYIDGVLTNNLTEKQRFILNSKISMVFQGSALFDSYTIFENVVFGLHNHKHLSYKTKLKIAVETLEQVGLDKSILKLYPYEISGGMQKRVGFARAIATNPKIIFFDEPTSGLDPISSTLINQLIVSITQHLKVTSLTITHDISSAKIIASKVLLLHDKTIEWQGSANELFHSNNPTVNNFVNGIPN